MLVMFLMFPKLYINKKEKKYFFSVPLNSDNPQLEEFHFKRRSSWFFSTRLLPALFLAMTVPLRLISSALHKCSSDDTTGTLRRALVSLGP